MKCGDRIRLTHETASLPNCGLELTRTEVISDNSADTSATSPKRCHDALLSALAAHHQTEIYRLRLALAIVSTVALAVISHAYLRPAAQPACEFSCQPTSQPASQPAGQLGCEWLSQPSSSNLPSSPNSPSSPVGPGPATTLCQEKVNAEYNLGQEANTVRPLTFEPSEVGNYRVFDDVTHIHIPAGVVTPQWTCSEEGCSDVFRSSERGFAYLWVPRGVARNASRLLYVHGGSWCAHPV